MEKFNLDLSLVARLGGHSQPRTHRGKERFPGMTITYALIQMLEKAGRQQQREREGERERENAKEQARESERECKSLLKLLGLLEQVAEKTDLARIITKAKVFKLIQEGKVCVGCVYEKGGQNFQEFGPVILASGTLICEISRESRAAAAPLLMASKRSPFSFLLFGQDMLFEACGGQGTAKGQIHHHLCKWLPFLPGVR